MKRKNIRFTPDKNTVVWFCKGHEEFSKDHVGLAYSEAYGGAGVVITEDLGLKEGDLVTVKIGELESIKSEIRWIKKISDSVYQFGIKYFE
ncbi:MAG: hypothetical protein KC478_04330 [Bacteriovoracaceae bacterium]|nr:hypothetical protein [Bacteriovoracaceae bacterium]